MNKRTKVIPLILIFATFLAGAGCAGKDKPSPADLEAQAFEDLRSEIRDVVSDAGRVEQAIAITEELENSFDRLRIHLAERSAKIQELNADYDAPKEDYIDLYKRIQKDIERNQSKISNLHRELVEVTTAEEWVSLKKLRNATMESAVTSIQSS
jgi:chromosome segregation ATPase